MVKKGDSVVTKQGLWHLGEDIGNRLGIVLDTTSYVMVELLDYNSNPIKCFRREVEVIEPQTEDSCDDFEFNFDLFNTP